MIVASLVKTEGVKMNSVCVFAGSSFGGRREYEIAAAVLGKAIAGRDLTLLYGGASVGLMGTVADAALQAGGRVVGVLPRALAELEIAHNGLTELKVVGSMHERKTVMADASDAFVALPGGLGTLEETFEVWTWSQLGVHAKPVGFVNVEGYFDKLFAFLDHTVEEGFVKSKHRHLAIRSSDPNDMLDQLAVAETTYEPKWINKPER